MTVTYTLITVGEIEGVEIVCPKCGTALRLPTSQWTSTPRDCANCHTALIGERTFLESGLMMLARAFADLRRADESPNPTALVRLVIPGPPSTSS